MTLRIFISMLLIGLFGIQGIGLSYAQDDGDVEYTQMIERDSRSLMKYDALNLIKDSITTDKLDKKSVQTARKTVDNYITGLEPYDVHWTGKHPKPIGNPIPYYIDDEGGPITYEWKIACDDTRDCGSVIVTTIDTDSRIMEASTYGLANYERLASGKESRKNKLYYYSVFDQYIESSDGKETTVDMINPLEQNKQGSSERKSLLKSEKKLRKEIKMKGKVIFLQEGLEGINDNTTSAATGTITTDIPSSVMTSNCSSPVPCYGQPNATYAGISCAGGCGPTALAIIFGYYDRKGTFPNLYGNSSIVASDVTPDATMIQTIGGYMGTYCVGGQGATEFGKLGLGMKYARDRGYGNSSNGVYSHISIGVGNFMLKVKQEINAGKPFIVNYRNAAQSVGHIMVAYGYRTNPIPTPNEIHVNFGNGSYFPDKYLPVSGALVGSSNSHDFNNFLIGMSLDSMVTVPMQ